MTGLPYFVPDSDKSLNLALILLIIGKFGVTPRGKPLINNERLRACLYLIKNPIVLNKVLASLSRPVATLEPYDEYSVAGISNNLDPLHDDAKIKSYLLHLAGLNYLKISYKKATGFMYSLTAKGQAVESQIAGDYFDSIRIYVEALQALNSVSTANLNAAAELSNEE